MNFRFRELDRIPAESLDFRRSFRDHFEAFGRPPALSGNLLYAFELTQDLLVKLAVFVTRFLIPKCLIRPVRCTIHHAVDHTGVRMDGRTVARCRRPHGRSYGRPYGRPRHTPAVGIPGEDNEKYCNTVVVAAVAVTTALSGGGGCRGLEF